ncbi:DUF1565 domain-containing protein, partial [Singulisphaera rosea]
MPTYYVATTGNDSTGNGSQATPWRTINKAYLAAANGDTILVADGTYQENSGSGWLQLSRQDAAITIAGQNGTSSNVTVQGTSSAQEVIYQGTNLTFKYVKFVGRDGNTTRIMRFNGGGSLTLIGCTFTVVSSTVQTNQCFASGLNTTGSFIGCTFDGCTFNQVGSNPAYGIYILSLGPTSVIDSFTIKNCIGIVNKCPCSLNNATNVNVTNNLWISTDPTVGYGLILGQDSSMSGSNVYAASGTIAGNIIWAQGGHACLIGAGVTAALVQGNIIIGGSNASNGQGLVIKEGSNIVVKDCAIFGGYLNGMYIKGAQSPTLLRNTVVNLFATATAFRVNANQTDPGANWSNALCQYNYIIAPLGTAIFIGLANAETGSSSVIDSNVYDVRGSGTWGTVRGTTLTGFASLATAWTGYGTAGNDSHSLAGGSANAHVYRHSSTTTFDAVTPKVGPFLYRAVFDRVGNVWNGTGFVPLVAANWYQYVNYLVEATPGGYLFTAPVSLNLPSGDYRVTIFSQLGSSPALGDTVLTTQDLTWDGSQAVRFGSVYSRLGTPSGGSLAADVASVKGDTT